MRTLYNLIYRLYLLFAAPWRVAKDRGMGLGLQSLGQRRGSYDRRLKQALTNRHVLWLHVNDRADVNLCTQLVRAIENRLPNLKLVASADEPSVLSALQQVLPGHFSKILFPMDRRAWVSRSISVIHPEAIIMLGASLPPNFLWRARAGRIPVFVVNTGKLYRTRRRYRILPALYRPLFRSLSGVAVQSQAEVAAFARLGCRPEDVRVVGMLPNRPAKVDERQPGNTPAVLSQLGVDPGAMVLVATGTRQPDQRPLIQGFHRLRSRFPNLFLVIAPEHVERSRELGRELDTQGLKFAYRNEITRQTQCSPGSVSCLLLNTGAAPGAFFGRASLVLAGERSWGGDAQDLLDAAAKGVPLVLWPGNGETGQAVAEFLKSKAAVRLEAVNAMESTCADLLADAGRRTEMGIQARQVARQQQAVLHEVLDLILRHLDRDELYIAS